MSTLTVVLRDGTERTLNGDDNMSVMELIRDAGIDEMLALCGGCKSCATCHVYVEPAYLDKLEPISSDENEMLEGSSFRNETSRLGCQIFVTDELDGLRVTIAPED